MAAQMNALTQQNSCYTGPVLSGGLSVDKNDDVALGQRTEAFSKLMEIQQKQSSARGSKGGMSAKPGLHSSSRSRHLTLLGASVLTMLALWFDSDFVDGGISSISSFSEWVLTDSTIAFYLVGFGTAYILFKPRSASKKARFGKSCGDNGATSAAKTGKGLPQCLSPTWSSRSAVKSSTDASANVNSDVARLEQALNEAATQGKAQRCEELISLLEGACKPELPEIAHYNQLMRAYARRGDACQCERWLLRLREQGPTPTESTYVYAMGIHGKAGDVQAVEALMKQMMEHGPKPGVLSYSLIIHACGRIGDVRKGSEWLQRMIVAGVTPGIAIYNSLMHASGVCDDPAGAQQWYEKALEQGAEPTVTTYTTLIDVSAKSLDLDLAERWMDEMIDRHIAPNVISYSTMMNACAKAGDLKRAEGWYEKMQGHGVQANMYSYSALIDACARVGDVDAACSWLTRAENSGGAVDAVVYGCVLNACGRTGDAEKAAEVFARLKAHGVRTGVVIYAALARPFAYRGDYEKVEQLAEEMEAEGIEMNDYFLYALLLAYSRASPRQGERAAKAFCQAAARGMPLAGNERVMKALGSSVGRARALELADLCCLTRSDGK